MFLFVFNILDDLDSTIACSSHKVVCKKTYCYVALLISKYMIGHLVRFSNGISHPYLLEIHLPTCGLAFILLISIGCFYCLFCAVLLSLAIPWVGFLNFWLNCGLYRLPDACTYFFGLKEMESSSSGSCVQGEYFAHIVWRCCLHTYECRR